MKTFEEWWETTDLREDNRIIVWSARRIAEYAWNAAIKCPQCGKDMRQICRYCPPLDIEQYYKDEEMP